MGNISGEKEKICDKYEMQIKIVKWAITAILVLPIIVNLLLKPIGLGKGIVSDWIAFYGALFGGIIGASAIYFVAKYQIDESYRRQRDNDKKNRNEIFRMNHEKDLAEELIICMIGINECIKRKKSKIRVIKRIIKSGNKEECRVYFENEKNENNDECPNIDNMLNKLMNINTFNQFTFDIWKIDRLFVDYFHNASILNIKLMQFEIRMRIRMRTNFDWDITQKDREFYESDNFYNYDTIIQEYCILLKTTNKKYMEMKEKLLRQIQIIIFNGIYDGKEYEILKLIGKHEMEKYLKDKRISK